MSSMIPFQRLTLPQTPVARALQRETAEAAVIILGQRVATIADADKIVVLEHGEIVGFGTHQELLANCPTYAEIVDSQLSAEEAAA